MPAFTHAVIGCGRVAPDDPRDVPHDADVDAVSIAVDHARHARLASTALKLGKHVLPGTGTRRCAGPSAARDAVETHPAVETPGQRPALGKEFAP
ncbi:hypothetical protein [Streptomyces winkii]|uniref:hypothetical protein n=1 Tax=Streptomyces winkii TaxID=3051178 RepID=UPI0028D0C6DD|nr:hypothetical protein [Streptomyces sp. DSM 40971]